MSLLDVKKSQFTDLKKKTHIKTGLDTVTKIVENLVA